MKKIYYKIAQIASWVVATFIFHRRFERNELKNAKRPFVVIANHEAALDFVNLIGATKKQMSFVVSSAFYNTLPVKGFMNKIGVIPKAQFQTSLSDIKKIKSVINSGGSIAIYPAGLMCEDGLSTPIPGATYKFLKFLGVDVYVARTTGSYFVMPKWTHGFRPGKTYIDIYRLFTKEELNNLDEKTIKERTNEALLFDAYREQEKYQIKYKKNDVLNGLENVLYICPNCKSEYTMQIQNVHSLVCTACGFKHTSDKFGFLHKESDFGKELRYVSDWSRWIHNLLKEKIANGFADTLSSKTQFWMIDFDKNKFIEAGEGFISLTRDAFQLTGKINGEDLSLRVPTSNFPSLPFKPGKYLDIQNGADIYRCVLEDGKLAMKYIQMVKIFHELRTEN